MKLIVKDSKMRIDKYLSLNTDFSRSLIDKMIADGFVNVNGEKIKSSYLIKENDIIDIKDDYLKKTSIEKEAIPLDIVFEDDDIMVINKPSGLVVHPGFGNQKHTLVNALLNHTDNLSTEKGLDRAGIVHRLDKDTSGLMLVAKTNKAHELLGEDFKKHLVKRNYIALLMGIFPSNKAKIDIPLGRSKTDFRKQEAREDGKRAITNLEVLKRYDKYTLVKLMLETGRTHQIRVHLSYLGYPIYNDPTYSNNKTTDFGQFLHSSSIDFIHPITKEKMHFECALPKEFQDFLKNLE